MIRIIKKFAKLLDEHQKRRVFLLFFIMLVGAFLEVLGVSLMVPLLTAVMQPDIVEKNKYVKLVCDTLHLQSYRSFVLVCIIALILVFIVKDLYIIFQYYAQYRFVYNNRFLTQCRLLHAFLHRPYEYFLHADSGEIMRVVQGDVDRTYGLLASLLGMSAELIVSAALLITVFIISPWMTLMVGVLLVLVMLLITEFVKPRLQRQGRIFQKHAAATNKWLMQAINGMKEIKVTSKEAFFEENYNRSGTKMIRAERYHALLQNTPRLLIEMSSVCSMLIVIGIMIYRGQEMKTLIPALGAFAMAAVKLMPSANRITTAMNSVAFQEPALDKLLENLEVLEEAVVHEELESRNSGKLTLKKEIVLSDITYAYPRGEVKVLEHAVMQIPVGKSVGIVGTSGAGKTTAVDILLGLLNPQEGQVLSDGIDVKTAYKDWLSHIGYIPQMIFMLDGSIRDNVAFGCEREKQTDERVWAALEEAQLADFVRGLPEGLDTAIGERGIRLSGGQRQRIGIARALFANPEVLVFDEATSALDNETEEAIMRSIHALHGKKTMIIIAHRLTTIEGCDIVYRVEDGRIVRNLMLAD
ncbi:MAG: ABC transporter ATP-binding protein/permease [Clostridium sp.]|nr:ABC transporter ATP-binding protein/permease [Clostridium sp.]